MSPTATTTYTLTATNAAGSVTATATVTITARHATTPTITWNTPASIIYGTALSATQLNATTTVAGTWAYSPAAGTVLSAGAGQTLSVTFTPTDTASYNSATRDGRDHRAEGDAAHHLGDAGRHRRRDAAERARS